MTPHEAPAAPVVRAEARCTVLVPADRAQLLVRLAAAGPTRARATAALRRAHTRLTRVLTRFDATVEHAQVLGSALEPDDAQSWVASAQVRIDVGDVRGLPQLAAALDKLAPAAVSGPTWSLRGDHPARAVVRRAATREATARARAAAEAGGGALGALDWVECTADPDPAETDRHPAAGDAFLLGVHPEPVPVLARARVQHRIAPGRGARTNSG